jgi:aspartate dehydrogenase
VSVAAQLAPTSVARGTTRVGVIGSGAIGAAVIRELARDAVAGAELVAVVDTREVPGCPVPQVRLAEALHRCDVLVECAGQEVVTAHAAEILDSGVDLLVTSVGALADPDVAARVLAAGPGRLLITAGAVGGVDLLASAAAHAPLRSVRVTTAKLPRALLQPWMDEAARRRIAEATEPVEVFRGGARDAARWFPRSLNVAATVAFAVGNVDAVEVVLVADPAAELTAHVIEADGDAGRYRFEIRNQPSPDNPSTSGVVPFAVLRSLSVLVGRPVRIV